MTRDDFYWGLWFGIATFRYGFLICGVLTTLAL